MLRISTSHPPRLQLAAYVYLLYNFTWLCELEVVDPPERAHTLSRGQVAVAERHRDSVRVQQRAAPPCSPHPAAATAAGLGSPELVAPDAAPELDPTPSPVVAPLSSGWQAYCMMAISHNAYIGCARLAGAVPPGWLRASWLASRATCLPCARRTHMAFSPHARLDDGLLDVCAIPRLSRLDLVAGIKEAEDLGKSATGSASGCKS